MTREENAKVSADTLKVICRSKLESEKLTLSDELAGKLDQLARADPDSANGWLQRLRKPLPDDPDQDEIAVLLDGADGDGPTEWWLTTLAYASIVLVVFDAGGGHRRVLSLSYDEPMNSQQRLTTRLGWRSFRILLISRFVHSGRYHLELTAPPDFRLTRAALGYSGASRPIDTSRARRRAHLYVDNAHEVREAFASFGLRVSGRGILGGAFAASALVLAAIASCIHFNEDIAKESGSAPALLLVLPGIIATYVAQSDQHGLATRLLAIPRWILTFAGISAYYAAGTIALFGGDNDPSLISSRLWPAAIVAGVATAVIGFGWLCTREATHRLREWVERLLAKSTRTGFHIQATVGILPETAWAHAVGANKPGLLPSPGHVEARKIIEQGRHYVIRRNAGAVKWSHGIRVAPAPEGATVTWAYRVSCPTAFRLVAGTVVVLESRAARRRLKALEAD